MFLDELSIDLKYSDYFHYNYYWSFISDSVMSTDGMPKKRKKLAMQQAKIDKWSLKKELLLG